MSRAVIGFSGNNGRVTTDGEVAARDAQDGWSGWGLDEDADTTTDHGAPTFPPGPTTVGGHTVTDPAAEAAARAVYGAVAEATGTALPILFPAETHPAARPEPFRPEPTLGQVARGRSVPDEPDRRPAWIGPAPAAGEPAWRAAAPAGVGPAGVGPAGLGSAGLGPAGVAPAAVGPAVGPAGVAPAGADWAGAGWTEPARPAAPVPTALPDLPNGDAVAAAINGPTWPAFGPPDLSVTPEPTEASSPASAPPAEASELPYLVADLPAGTPPPVSPAPWPAAAAGPAGPAPAAPPTAAGAVPWANGAESGSGPRGAGGPGSVNGSGPQGSGGPGLVNGSGPRGADQPGSGNGSGPRGAGGPGLVNGSGPQGPGRPESLNGSGPQAPGGPAVGDRGGFPGYAPPGPNGAAPVDGGRGGGVNGLAPGAFDGAVGGLEPGGFDAALNGHGADGHAYEVAGGRPVNGHSVNGHAPAGGAPGAPGVDRGEEVGPASYGPASEAVAPAAYLTAPDGYGAPVAAPEPAPVPVEVPPWAVPPAKDPLETTGSRRHDWHSTGPIPSDWADDGTPLNAPAGLGRRTTVVMRYLLGLLTLEHFRRVTRWAWLAPVVGLALLLVHPRWIGLAVVILGVLMVVVRWIASGVIHRAALPRRFRPVEPQLLGAVEAGKTNLRVELRNAGLPTRSWKLAIFAVRLARPSNRSDLRDRLRQVDVDKVLPRVQLERALRLLEDAGSRAA
jgi:hypothetical protein